MKKSKFLLCLCAGVQSCLLATGVATVAESRTKVPEIVTKSMYEFSVPSDLVVMDEWLKSYASEAIYRSLSLSNVERVTYAYQRFGYQPSSVRKLAGTSDWFTYRLMNESVPIQKVWLTLAGSSGGQLTDVREYEISGVQQTPDWEWSNLC